MYLKLRSISISLLYNQMSDKRHVNGFPRRIWVIITRNNAIRQHQMGISTKKASPLKDRTSQAVRRTTGLEINQKRVTASLALLLVTCACRMMASNNVCRCCGPKSLFIPDRRSSSSPSPKDLVSNI